MRLNGVLKNGHPYYKTDNGDIRWVREEGDLDMAPQLVTGNFACDGRSLTSLKGGPTVVHKSYNCSDNELVNLEGAPESVEGTFKAEDNVLISLEGAPKRIRVDFVVDGNKKLNSFEGAPLYIGGLGSFRSCGFESLLGIETHLKHISDLDIEHNKIVEGGLGLLLIDSLFHVYGGGADTEPMKRAFNIINKYLRMKNREKFIYDCQKELVEAGLEAFAEL